MLLLLLRSRIASQEKPYLFHDPISETGHRGLACCLMSIEKRGGKNTEVFAANSGRRHYSQLFVFLRVDRRHVARVAVLWNKQQSKQHDCVMEHLWKDKMHHDTDDFDQMFRIGEERCVKNLYSHSILTST
jgi:hypothetical protein